MHRHLTDTVRLSVLLPAFSGGEFITRKGRGKGSEVYYGKIEKVIIPHLTRQKICIHTKQVYKKVIGCKADFSDTIRWEQVEFPSGELAFDYSWFYQQPRHARLKLEFVPKNEDGGKEESKEKYDRCWLCSDTDPINLELFRTMLMAMFLKESRRKETLFRRLRKRLFVHLL